MQDSWDYDSDEEAGIVKASVVKDDGRYGMWFSYRAARGYRHDRSRGYRIGYAESADGVHWTRRDDQAGIDLSDEGWDSRMQAYPHVIDHRGARCMFYNGNGFGRSGFGYARWED